MYAKWAKCATSSKDRVGIYWIKCLITDLYKISFKFWIPLLLNEGIPRAYRGKKLRLKNILFFPRNLRVLPANSDGSICKKWMQNALRFVMKNRSFSSLINNFKIRIKSYSSKRKNLYFSSEIQGRFAFTFCRYFHHNLQVLPSNSVAGNTLIFRGKFQYIFQTKFFPLEFEGISYHSVKQFCPFIYVLILTWISWVK